MIIRLTTEWFGDSGTTLFFRLCTDVALNCFIRANSEEEAEEIFCLNHPFDTDDVGHFTEVGVVG